ncbi:MAG: glycoside hydrolase family 3 C-terminal domain-containing protein [Anaerolineae bacterium]|nr:glycoside hydrolase family 3 C-terminal domain-containing protein [Anaerolineae bacterium]
MVNHEKAIYRNAAYPIPARVDDLLSQMTVDEKLAQLGSKWVFELLESQQFSEAKAQTELQHGIGQITRLAGASNVSPNASAALANTIQSYLINHTRLGIPAIVHEECCSGYMAKGATVFPQAIGVASTWDAELTEDMGDVIRTQMRMVGGHQALAPVLDVTRDPRWGRVEETFGEDPYLVSQLGVAYVNGIQGKDLTAGVVATGKHFVGYGLSEGGRNWAPVFLPERELLEVFVCPFAVAIQAANLRSIMNAYHELDGIPCGASKALLTDLLRDRLGFDGLLVSDYFSVDMLMSYHHLTGDKQSAAVLALEAGIDLELPSTDCYGDPLREALDTGAVEMAVIDRAVSRVLAMKFELGLFEKPFVDAAEAVKVFDTPEQRDLARQIAQKSMVLLKNEGNLLPLDKSIKKLAVIGPNADSVRNLMGDYSYPAHVETLLENDAFNTFDAEKHADIELVDRPVEMYSILESIQQKVSKQTEILYAPGCEVNGRSTEGFAAAVTAAEQADVVILVVGGKSGLTDDCTCGEARDRADLNLPGVQEQLVHAIGATGKPVVLVLVNGRPLTITWSAEHLPAIVEAWLPGEEGANAVVDVLFGDYNPGGKLPITFPRAVGQIPIFYNHKPSGGRSHWKTDYVETSAKPLFPFGFGLSYTQFVFANLQLSTEIVSAADTVEISVDVTNQGTRLGDEVVQLYVHYTGPSVTRPVKELKGFQRVTLAAGETQQVIFPLAVSQLAFYDQAMQLVVEPGTVQVMLGSSSEDIHCTSEFKIT